MEEKNHRKTAKADDAFACQFKLCISHHMGHTAICYWGRVADE